MGAGKNIGAWLALAAALASCGGGGGGGDGEDLYASVSYGGAALSLYGNASVRPVLAGFDGHEARCSLASGSVPPGMQLQGDCSITGRPTQAGAYSFTVTVSAQGAKGSFESGGTLTVAGPFVSYTDRGFLNTLELGATVDDPAQVLAWEAPAGETLAWSYAVTAGALPTGLALDTTTGRITGVATAAGSYDATIQATLATAYGSYRLVPSHYRASVNVPTFGYTNTGGTRTSAEGHIAYVSQPFEARPTTAAPGTLSAFSLANGANLYMGLSLDANTGVISGVLGSPFVGGAGTFDLDATFTSGAITLPVHGKFPIDMRSPVRMYYSTDEVQVNVPLLRVYVMEQESPLPLGPLTIGVHTMDPICTLPPGVNFDTATGIFSGIPTATGSYVCPVYATITHNGVTWRQYISAGFLVH